MIACDWVGELPESWKVKPLRALARYVVSSVDKVPAEDEISVRLCNYTDVYNNEYITLDLTFMEGTATADEIESFSLNVGDVVITKDSESWDDIGVPALVSQTAADLVCGYHLAILRPSKGQLEGAFLMRCLQAKTLRIQLELAANGVTRFGIPKSAIGGMKLPIPPLFQQRVIARFLDRETTRIDALLRAKKQLLDLLSEKRKALVLWVTTRGCDLSNPLQDSNISWLGPIPAKWQTCRVAWLFKERDERGEPDLPLLEVSINSGVVLREFSEDRIESTAADFNTYKVARKGDIVFNKMRMWQGAVGVAPQDGLVSPDYVVAAPTGALLSEYAGLLFRTAAFSAECARHSHGIVWDRLRLYWEGFREIEVPVPPFATQSRIIEHVAAETGKLDSLRVATECTISLLKERRSALITAAVTGQIDLESHS